MTSGSGAGGVRFGSLSFAVRRREIGLVPQRGKPIPAAGPGMPPGGLPGGVCLQAHWMRRVMVTRPIAPAGVVNDQVN